MTRSVPKRGSAWLLTVTALARAFQPGNLSLSKPGGSENYEDAGVARGRN
jgi:hypothetical protein